MILQNALAALTVIKSRVFVGAVLISAFYFFGLIGILSDVKDWFVSKTALNLTLSFVVLVIYQKKYSWSLVWAFVFCYLIGYAAEYLGVNFNLIFGDYIYPDTLGPQVGGVPLIIGINWFLLTFCVASVILPLRLFFLWKILLATLITVLIDVAIEPVAMHLNFWNWENNIIPLQNYVGWAVISFIIFSFYSAVGLPLKNKMAKFLLLWQIIFFVVLNVLLI